MVNQLRPNGLLSPSRGQPRGRGFSEDPLQQQLFRPQLNSSLPRVYKPSELPPEDLLVLLPGNAYCKVSDVYVQDRNRVPSDTEKVYAVPLAGIIRRYSTLVKNYEHLKEQCLYLKRERLRSFYQDSAPAYQDSAPDPAHE
ncbi:hypothetical protein GNI_102170 [Gregarina niphandrodes]|uniref:Uncharacterized protein n=1 Tax=Gregarina niphandrodes TaxID=110365 RepID=A0A023B4F0_GRENI|nr:hypothetical protein GNI_102170 [Gregarina niphandrodes]EZG56677.1 hypothetical protein GNI_102170 [Gregarina niphandrodes]|eukprot:XP_011131207.1 hypothetical protein GNI_102170 [Gregarina niphandrodes]